MVGALVLGTYKYTTNPTCHLYGIPLVGGGWCIRVWEKGYYKPKSKPCNIDWHLKVRVLDYNILNIWNTISSNLMTPNSKVDWNQNGKNVGSIKDNFTRKNVLATQ